MARKSAATSFDAQPQVRPPFDMDSLVEGGPQIEVVTDSDFQKVAEDEAFMNEIIKIRFISNGDPNAPKMVELGVNTAGRTGKMGSPTDDYPDGRPGTAARGGKSVKKGFAYNVVYDVPRYVAEVAAHAKITSLQQVADPRDPMRMMHVERSTFFYPFEVVADKNPKGRMWLEKILSDPA